MGLTNYINKLIAKHGLQNVLTGILCIVGAPVAIVTVFAFFGIQNAKDLLFDINSFINIYTSLSVDLKILLIGGINLVFTLIIFNIKSK